MDKSGANAKYVPDRWVILEISDGATFTNKVFAGWYGGYLGEDSWKLNSGNVEEREFDDRWEFVGASGSVYVCRKNAYGMSSHMARVLEEWEDGGRGNFVFKMPDKYSPKDCGAA